MLAQCTALTGVHCSTLIIFTVVSHDDVAAEFVTNGLQGGRGPL